jgi:hypothetical protein
MGSTPCQATLVADFAVDGMHAPFFCFGIEKLIVRYKTPGLADIKIDLDTGHVLVTIFNASLDVPLLRKAFYNAGFLARETVTITTAGMVMRDDNGNFIFMIEGDTNKFYLMHADNKNTLPSDIQKKIKTLYLTGQPADLVAEFECDKACKVFTAKSISKLALYTPPACCPQQPAR